MPRKDLTAGYALIEAIVAAALMLAVTAVVLVLVELARESFAVQSEAVDVQQRLRVAAGALYGDLIVAGAGASQGANVGPLIQYFAPVLPYRHGTNRDDLAGSFKHDAITVMSLPRSVAQTTLAGAGPADVSADVGVSHGPGCPLLDVTCGFKSGMTILAFDGSGEYDTFTITGLQPAGLHVQRTGGVLTYGAYQPETTTLAEARNVVYYLKTDAATGLSQLVSREGDTGADMPVIDHLVGLRFDYFGDPQPPRWTGPAGDRVATYGPRPPPLSEQAPTGGYPAGENCTFVVDPVNGEQVSRLPVLDEIDAASGLAILTASQLTDGPWCPDAANPNRWDADLLRIRSIAVTLRIEAADPAVRGPAGILFTNGGTTRRSTRWLPDQTIKFQVTPRNLSK
jgi:hypothetical protein